MASAHILFSVGLAIATSAAYTHRLINVRAIDDMRHLRPVLIADFFADNFRNEARRKLLVIGTSFSWGYSWPEEDIYSWTMQERLAEHYKVLNGSVIGARPAVALEALCVFRAMGLRLDDVVLEVNVLNFSSMMDEDIKPCPADDFLATISNPFFPYFRYYFENPIGLNHFKLLWDEFNYRQADQQMAIAPLPASYFEDRDAFDKNFEKRKTVIQAILAESKKVADRTIFFVSPFNETGTVGSGGSWEEVLRQSQTLQAICEETTGIECLPLRMDLDAEYFSNLNHLNIAGHEYWGNYIADVVESK